MNALRVRTWPTKATNTVTKDASIVLASSVAIREPVAGLMGPVVDIARPHRGWMMAAKNQRPLRMVEYSDRMRVTMGNQLRRRMCTFCREEQSVGT